VWRGLVTIVELIDPRPYEISLPISKADLHCNLYERQYINSSKSKSKSPFAPPPELRSTLKPPYTKLFNRQYDEAPSNFALNFNLCRYNTAHTTSW